MMDGYVLYHLPFLPPRYAAWEAISQEVAALRRLIAGEVVYVNPNAALPLHIPRLLFGFHRLPMLWRRERAGVMHHFYNPDPFPFPYLRLLRRPVIYSLTGGVDRLRRGYFSHMAAITVADEASWRRLREMGVERLFLVRPGIETARFTPRPKPLGTTFHLLVGSAPWSREQFRSKGVLALLEAARREPRLRLTFLWRGILAEEMARRVEAMGVASQVSVLDRLVDVDALLGEMHAAIVLAATPTIVKAYPHSLMEALAAGKPVLVSRAIPMAMTVERLGCGVVVEQLSAEAILEAVERLQRDYARYSRAALESGRPAFSQEAMLASFRAVYRSVLRLA